MTVDLFLIAPQRGVDDDATKITHDWSIRLGNLWANSTKFKVRVFSGTSFELCNQVRSSLEQRLAMAQGDPEPAVMIFLGHGARSYLAGTRPGARVVDQDDGNLLKNIFVFAVACRSAVDFGHRVVRSGASGFMGYNERVKLHPEPEIADELYRCLIHKPLDHMLNHGSNGSQVRQVVLDELRVIRQRCQSLMIKNTEESLRAKLLIPFLDHHYDFIVHLGNPDWRL